MEERARGLHARLPVSLILAVSMIAAGVVYPVTDSALKHTSPIMIATLRALVGGVILTLMLPLLRSRLPRTRRLWAWAFTIGLGNTTLTQVGISVGTARAGAAVGDLHSGRAATRRLARKGAFWSAPAARTEPVGRVPRYSRRAGARRASTRCLRRDEGGFGSWGLVGVRVAVTREAIPTGVKLGKPTEPVSGCPNSSAVC
jgi:hypothetical protein